MDRAEPPTPFRRGRAILLALLAGLAVAPPACRKAPVGGPPAGDGILDATGAAVRVPPRPARIVSLVPAATEALFRLGAGDRVVGVTAHCTRPVEAGACEKVGTFLQPDVERILSLRPDLVIAAKAGRPEPVFRLRELGLCVFVAAEGRSFAEVRETYLLLGRLAGVPEEARRGVSEAEAKLRAVDDRLRGRPPVPAFVQLGAKPLVAAGGGTFVDDVVRRAGGRNLGAQIGAGYPRTDPETVIGLDPAVILVTTMTGFPDEEKDAWKAFPSLSAARSGRIHGVSGDDLCRPDPFAFAAAVETVARLLHPEAFPDRDARSSQR
jgi:iron complex transport system substrate-binding protein